MSLRSSSQQPPGVYRKWVVCSRDSNPSRRICNLPAVSLKTVDKGRSKPHNEHIPHLQRTKPSKSADWRKYFEILACVTTALNEKISDLPVFVSRKLKRVIAALSHRHA